MIGKQQQQLSNQAQSMKSSRTMPHLHYTRQDIQEQYLGPKQARAAGQPVLASQNQVNERPEKRRSRPKSSDPKKQHLKASGLQSSAEESAASSEFDSSLAETKPEGGLAKRKRRRRAHSASLFSACFTIPSQLGVILGNQTHASSPSRSQTRRSFLAHLGLASGQKQGQQGCQSGQSRSSMRPISSSQTAGDLRSLAPDEQQPDDGRPSRRDELNWRPKHVSFETNRSKQQQGELVCPSQSADVGLISRDNSAKATPVPTGPSAPGYKSDIQEAEWRKPSSSIYLANRARASAYSDKSNQENLHKSQGPAKQPTMTLYKRLPTVPMRTQATQTDITAYHLTPAASSLIASSSSSLIMPPSCQQRIHPSPVVLRAPDPAAEDGSDEWSVDDEEPVATGERRSPDLAPASASPSPRSSSSSSSSPVSLIGHDSTFLLAADSMIDASIMLEAGPRAAQRTNEDDGPPSGAREPEIEPPSQFKDFGGRGQRPIVGAAGNRMNIDGAREEHQAVAAIQSAIEEQFCKDACDDALAASPPSLSEASSQTDALLTDLGRALARVAHPARLKAGPKQVEDTEGARTGIRTARASAATEDKSEASDGLQLKQTNLGPLTGRDQLKRDASDAPPPPPFEEHDNLCPTGTGEPSGGRERSQDKVVDSVTATSEFGALNRALDCDRARQNATKGANIELSAATLQHTNSLGKSSRAEGQIIMDNGASGAETSADHNELAGLDDRPETSAAESGSTSLLESDLLSEAAPKCLSSELSSAPPDNAPAAGLGGARAGASPAEQRRDDFLTLDTSQLDRLGAGATNTEPSKGTFAKRPSTSTLSARHHSYCSNDDLDAPAHRSLSSDESGRGLFGSEPEHNLVEIDECSLLQFDKDINDVNSNPDPACRYQHDQNLDLSSSPVEPASSDALATDLSPIYPADRQEVQRTEPSQEEAAANRADNGQVDPITRDCDHFMIATSSYKSTPIDERSPEEEAMAGELSRRLLCEVQLHLLDQVQPSSGSSGDSSVVGRSEVGGATSSSSLANDLANLEQPPELARAESPPTTVSELDLDEDISTPSFVTNYQSRLAQVYELADRIATSLIDECLGAAQPADEGASVLAELESGSSSSSTTSVSGRSYTCCHPKLEPHVAKRPQVPFKPAHLRRSEVDGVATAAAALVVATSSVAGAAAALQASGETSTGRASCVPEVPPAQEMDTLMQAGHESGSDDEEEEGDEAARSGSVCSTVSVIRKHQLDEPGRGENLVTSAKFEQVEVDCCQPDLIAWGDSSSSQAGRAAEELGSICVDRAQLSPLPDLFTVSEVSEETSNDKRAQEQLLLTDGLPDYGSALDENEEGRLEAATEVDLAQSEYTLRSQCSEATNAALTLDSRSASSTSNHLDAACPQSSKRPARKLADHPHVHEPIRALSPPLPASSVAPGSGVASHLPRLTHDDTMEAIEDDVEGEEQEAAELMLEQQRVDPEAGSASPPALSGTGAAPGCPAHSPLLRPASIVEEEEEPEAPERSLAPCDDCGDEDDDDEESSISVSQHGVLVVQTSVDQACGVTQTPTSGRMSATTEAEDQTTPTHTRSPRGLVDMALEEPEPALEDSRPVLAPTTSGAPERVDPGPSKDTSTQSSSSSRVDLGGAMGTSSDLESDDKMSGIQSGTGTIKRRSSNGSLKASKQSEPCQTTPEKSSEASNVPTSSFQRRGPPLGQLKPPGSELSGVYTSGSLADTSICSSCSCMDSPSVVKPDSHHAGSKRKVSAWASQEEGTVVTDNYWLSHWLYVSELEEAEIWRRAVDMSSSMAACTGASSTTQADPMAAGMPKEMNDTASTASERNFCSRYKSTTRKMIHRRAAIEMYRRLLNNTLQSEKRVEINRSNGEFGFRIHGSRPVVVSAIERGTSAETCGLQVGDVIYAINGINILDMAHSDVVKLAHKADMSALVLDLVPTNDFLRMSKYNRSINRRHEPILTGFMMRLSSSTAQPLLIELQERMACAPGASSQQRATKLNQVMRLAWRQRYYILRSDNCLYWYKSTTDIEPHGGINLQGFSASLTNEFSEPNYVIRLAKYGGQPHYLGTNNICDIQAWIDAINKAATEANQNDPYMKRTLTLARGKPDDIPEADCQGYLYKFSHKRGGGAHWRAAYFVLKDACLYLYKDQQQDLVSQASSVYYLHGYKVRSKHIESKKHTLELIPPNKKAIKPIFLMANSETDKRRWIAALEYSIDRWIEVG